MIRDFKMVHTEQSNKFFLGSDSSKIASPALPIKKLFMNYPVRILKIIVKKTYSVQVQELVQPKYSTQQQITVNTVTISCCFIYFNGQQNFCVFTRWPYKAKYPNQLGSSSLYTPMKIIL